MRLRPDLVLLPLDGDAVAFSEEAQCLFSLNPPAALIARALQNGAGLPDLAQLLATEGLAPQAEAARWVAATLEAFAMHGMLEGGPATPVTAAAADENHALPPDGPPARRAPFRPVTERRYRLLETCALIRFGAAIQMRWVDTVIGHLGVDDTAEPSVVIDVEATVLDDGELRSDIYLGETVVGCALRASRLAPIVKSALWQSAINAHDFLFYIHAGVVGTSAGGVLLPASAGSGKTSLTAALVHCGFRYYSDEVALIDPVTFHVPAMPLAMAIKSTGWDLIAGYFPKLTSLAVHIRNDAKALRYLAPPDDGAPKPPMPVSHIIFPRYDPDAPTRLDKVARSAALGRLMGECLALRQRLNQRNVRDTVSWIAGIDCYELTFTSLDAAVRMVVDATGHERPGERFVNPIEARTPGVA